jgi:hypothetical protein
MNDSALLRRNDTLERYWWDSKWNEYSYQLKARTFHLEAKIEAVTVRRL